jgi:hypothetical protein
MLVEVKNLHNLLLWYDKLLSREYVFRGQPNVEPLTSSFERAIKGVGQHNWGDIEQKIILEFKRRAHHYIAALPQGDSHLEWLALMQHYGCPTRLLDFTKSFYVGLFFAIDGANSDAILWAVDGTHFTMSPPSLPKEHLTSSYDEMAEKEANKLLNESAKEDQEAKILLVEPFRMNERISIQQGLFLFPTNLYKPFEENICNHLAKVESFGKYEKQEVNKYALIKIVIPKELHTKIAYWLSIMNITAATLFPGLEGFARSQMTHIKYAEFGEKALNELIIEAMKMDHESKIKAAFEGMK